MDIGQVLIMLMPASVEFAALCQSQVAIMAQVFSADSTAIYLAESWDEQELPKLIPVAVYPPASRTANPESDSLNRDRALPGQLPKKTDEKTFQSLQPSPLAPTENDSVPATVQVLLTYGEESQAEEVAPQQLAIPLVHEGGVMGILVSWRADRPWQSEERRKFEEYARSIALACVLDQRGQWLQNQLSTLNHLQTQQSDRFHELLHQLRNPLTTLKTFAKLLVKRLAPEDKNQSLATNMLREGDRMQHILGYFDDTLQAADQTRTETGKVLPLLAPVKEEDTILETSALPIKGDSLSHFGGTLDIGEYGILPLITPLVESTKTLAEAANMRLHIFRPEQELKIRVDANALIEIINNFLENSLKYSLPGTDIWLIWGLFNYQHPHFQGILVGDTGPGIPKKDQPHVFERNYRGVQTSGNISGSGLGLAIVYDLIQEMNGIIEVYSPLSELPLPMPDLFQGFPKNRGTAFVIWLPQAD